MVNPGAPERLLAMRVAPSGTRAMRSCSAVTVTPRRAMASSSSARASSRTSIPTPKAAATASAVMSSCVGPMPPEVKT